MIVSNDNDNLFGWAAAQRGMNLAAGKWSAEEQAAVMAAIYKLALALRILTTQNVWIELGPGFRVTKGIGAMMLAAQRLGWIVNDGLPPVTCDRGGKHDHSQQLRIWRSLIYVEAE